VGWQVGGMKSPRAFALLVLAWLCPVLVSAAERKPLLIYTASLSEQRVVVVSYREKEGKPVLELLQSEGLGARASAILHHPDHALIYVAAKDNSGFVFKIRKDGRLERFAEPRFNSGYCYLSLDRTRRYLLGACYESGNVDVYRLDTGGLPAKLCSAINEKKTTAHAVAVSMDNRFAYVSYVKEENALLQYRFDAASGRLTPQDPVAVKIPAHLGPRHMAFHPTRPVVYFSNEQQLGVSAFTVKDNGQLEALQVLPAVDTPPAKGLAASDIRITPDGRFVYVAVRGFGPSFDAVFGYAVQADGRLKALGYTETGSIPWALGMSPHGDRLFVSTSREGVLTAYAIGPGGGLEKEATLALGKDFWDMRVVEP
jgi:6-phosphogluconolactonase